ncbi:MAG: PfkB family carbohydrate kinase [Geminicoccaceae bacterium]|nr:PfkB family carbohydrate kinase [Geminicoccaceae bacterium]
MAVQTLAVGIAVLDQVFLVPALPTGPAKHLATGYREILGGMAANAAATAARLGARSRLLSRVGDDSAGTRIVDELAAHGVVFDDVERVAGMRSSCSAVILDASGERVLVNHAPEELLERAPAPPPSTYGAFDAVLVDGRWPAAAVRALELARSRRVPGLADLDHAMREPEATALLAAASHIAFSRDGLMRWTGETDPLAGLAAIRQRTRGALAVTLGGEGVLFVANDRLDHLPAFPVRAVDTLGAGDTFHGALLVALAEGTAWCQALRFAAAAAALRCTRPGGRRAFPSRAEVEALLASDRTEEVSP